MMKIRLKKILPQRKTSNHDDVFNRLKLASSDFRKDT